MLTEYLMAAASKWNRRSANGCHLGFTCPSNKRIVDGRLSEGRLSPSQSSILELRDGLEEGKEGMVVDIYISKTRHMAQRPSL